MARLKNGILGRIAGKLANLVTYERLGENVARMRPHKPKRKKKRTPAQQAVNIRFSLIKSFVSASKGFVSVSFAPDVKGTTRIPENGAVSYNLMHAVTGEFPDFRIDFEKVLVSKGKLPAPEDATVTLEEKTLKFTWNAENHSDYPRSRDQVMLYAYFPDTKGTEFITSGARRIEGQDELNISYYMQNSPNAKKDSSAEVFIAFISDDRKAVSDSVYLGSISLEV